MCGVEDTPSGLKEYMTPDDWRKSWQDGDSTFFHSDNLSPIFLKMKEEIINGKDHAKVFVPFCGKVLEMKWLAENGHVVVGVEVSEDGIKQFFEENKLPYITKEIQTVSGTLYECTDKTMCLKLYCCSFYDFKPEVENNFDAVWDSAAFQASNKADRKQYVSIIHSVLKTNGKVFMAVDEFIQKEELPLDIEEIKNNFDGKFSVEVTDFVDANEEYQSKFKIKGTRVYTILKA